MAREAIDASSIKTRSKLALLISLSIWLRERVAKIIRALVMHSLGEHPLSLVPSPTLSF